MLGEQDELASLLWNARRTGTLLPVPAQEPSLEQAYAIQQRLHGYCNLPVMVWKMGLTAEPPRIAMGATAPIVGRLPSSAIYCDRSAIPFAGAEMFAEAELVFEIGTDLPPAGAPYTRETVIPALKGIYGGIEIATSRFAHTDLPLGLLVADNAMAHGLVLGKLLAKGWDDRFAAMPVTLARNDEPAVEGNSTRVLGNPLDALVWIANWLCDTGEGGLRREQLVASGTCTGVTQVFTGDTVTASFGDMGETRISVSN